MKTRILLVSIVTIKPAVWVVRSLLIMATVAVVAAAQRTIKKDKTMQHTSFWDDDTGFVISAELVLVASILVIGIIVGLSEIQHAVVSEMNDVADAVGSLNQSYWYSGFSKVDGNWSCCGQVHAFTRGSYFVDTVDACDNNQCDISCDVAMPEGPKPELEATARIVEPSKPIEKKSGNVDEIRRHLHEHKDHDHKHEGVREGKAPELPQDAPKKAPKRKRDAA